MHKQGRGPTRGEEPGGAEALDPQLLMSTGLTFGTISSLYGLSAGIKTTC